MRSGAVMAWSNWTWYYVSMAWCGTAVAPLITHWSCCSLAVGHQYNTVATGLGRKQLLGWAGNKVPTKKKHPTSHPHRWALGCLGFFLRIYEIYRAMTAPQPHWNLVCLFFPQLCTHCTPRTYGFVLAMYHLHWLMLRYQAAENANENKLHFDFFYYYYFNSLFFSSFFPSTTWHLLCITDIWPHKPRLLAPFSM